MDRVVIEQLARNLRDAQDAARPPPGAYAKLRREIIQARPRRSRRVAKTVVLLAACLGVIAVAMIAFRPRTLSLDVGGGTLTGDVGAQLEAPRGATLPLRFSDGSELELESSARMLVSRVANESVDLALQRGRLSAAIESAGRTRWRVDAGPIEVTVTGTRFVVSWDPASEQFDLEVSAGSVRVRAGNIHEHRVAAGGRLHLDCKRNPAECGVGSAKRAPQEPAARPPSGAPPPEDGVEAERKPSPPAPAPSSQADAAGRDWRQLARTGKYKDAMQAVTDPDAVIASGSAADLMLLANAARFSGSGALAQRALMTLRQRFAGHALAAEAAFMLGRSAFDGAGNTTAAARWFNTYLAERPGGPYAREAQGRLIECYQRQGASGAARAQAERYLKTYPNGPHAPLARSLIGE